MGSSKGRNPKKINAADEVARALQHVEALRNAGTQGATKEAATHTYGPEPLYRLVRRLIVPDIPQQFTLQQNIGRTLLKVRKIGDIRIQQPGELVFSVLGDKLLQIYTGMHGSDPEQLSLKALLTDIAEHRKQGRRPIPEGIKTSALGKFVTTPDRIHTKPWLAVSFKSDHFAIPDIVQTFCWHADIPESTIDPPSIATVCILLAAFTENDIPAGQWAGRAAEANVPRLRDVSCGPLEVVDVREAKNHLIPLNKFLDMQPPAP